MSRRNKHIVIENVEIESIADKGNSLGRKAGEVIFVKEAVPGDIIDVQVTKKRKSYKEGYPLKYHKYSEDRVDAFCQHFGVCGGCKWQHLNYQAQLKHKQQQVIDSLERIAKVQLPEIPQIIPSEKTVAYRNKLEFTFSNKRWLTKAEIDSESPLERNALGFHIPKLFDKIVDVETCHLMPSLVDKIRNEVRKFSLENEFTFFDIREQHGLLRNLMIRMTDFGEVMVMVQFFENDQTSITKLMDHLKITFIEITSLLYVVNSKKNDTFHDLEVIKFHGNDHIIEAMGELKFKIGAKSFYQTNSSQAKKLYDVALDFADLEGTELVYDLYTGTGTIANYCAQKAKKVVGIEYVEDAIKDAFENAKMNNITNTDFFAGDMKDLLNDDFISSNGKPDVIITDPPRAGMHTNVIEMMLKVAPKKIVYVSCNPATQARDIQLMDELYQVSKVQPVDMFPHTHHVENVVLLELR